MDKSIGRSRSVDCVDNRGKQYFKIDSRKKIRTSLQQFQPYITTAAQDTTFKWLCFMPVHQIKKRFL
jgi:hypothetical protein